MTKQSIKANIRLIHHSVAMFLFLRSHQNSCSKTISYSSLVRQCGAQKAGMSDIRAYAHTAMADMRALQRI